MKSFIKHSAFLAAGAAALLSAHSAMADQLYQVTVNTASLISDSSDAPLWLDFLWTNGSTTATTNNPVTLSNFSFGGGSVTAGTAYDSGSDVSGDLSSTVSIGDVIGGSSSFTNEFAEQFTPGSTVTFDMLLPLVGQPGTDGAEDLQFFIDAGAGATDFADASSNPLYTTAPDTGSLLDTSSPAIDAPPGPGSAFTMNTYQTTSPSPLGVTVSVVALPEPGSYACAALGMVAMLAFGRKLRRSRA